MQWYQNLFGKLFVLFFKRSGISANYRTKNFEKFCQTIVLFFFVNNEQK